MPIPNRINRESTGFLSLFRAKVGGRGPSDLRESVQPSIDVSPYLASNLIKVGVSEVAGTNPAVGSAVNVSIPQNQTWVIYAICGSIFTEADLSNLQAASCEVRLQNLTEDDGTTTPATLGALRMSAFQTSPAADSFTYVPPGPMLLPQGTQIRNEVTDSDVLTNWTIRISVLYAELTV